MNRFTVLSVAAGASLTIGCGPKAAPADPAPPEGAPVIPEAASAAAATPVPVVDPSLPTWDSVESGHPEGATNPPFPVLILTPEGDCYKDWVSPMKGPSPNDRDRVQACGPDECGTRVQCPPDAVDRVMRPSEN
jgi:hypothetical protein